MSAGRVAQLWRHPVKSLGAERLAGVELAAGAWMPFDRLWALSHGASAFDPVSRDWVEPNAFVRVTHAPRLAQVTARWEDGRIVLCHPDRPPLTADPETAEGRSAIADWAGPLAAEGRPGPFAVVRARQPLSDVDKPWVSVLSLDSLRALGERMGRTLDPRRFRGNLWLAGPEPWAEAGWAGRSLEVGGARLRVIEPIWRCAATEADPELGARDAPVLRALREATGDTAFGVYAAVEAGGAVAEGDAARLA